MTTTTTEPSFLEQVRVWFGFGAPPQTPDVVEPLALGPTERVVWTRTLGSVWPYAVAAVLVIAGIVMLVAGVATGAMLLGVSFVVLAFARITVTVDPSGLRVRFGLLPWPTKHVPIANIERASAIELLPVEWGGWGYRIAAPAKGFKRTAVVLRKGEAIHLQLTNNREFAVTVGGAAEAAALLNAYVARAS